MKPFARIIFVSSLAFAAGCVSVPKVDNAPVVALDLNRYLGEEDTTCHAHKGRTARTNVMYAPKRDQNRKWRFTLKNPMTNG